MDAEPMYYKGYLDALLYMQADLDTKESAVKGISPVLKARLPHEYWNGTDYEPFDPDKFIECIDDLNEDCSECVIIAYKLTLPPPRRAPHREATIEIVSTEGYTGVPERFNPDNRVM